jgi:hypothetical protein
MMREMAASVASRHVHLDDVEEFLVDHAFLLAFHDRDLDAFGVDVGGDAAEISADVLPVRHAAGEAREHALMEDGHRHGEMVEMAAGEVRIIRDVDVALAHVLLAELLDLGFDGLRHAADEHRQAEPDGHGVAIGREEPDGEVERFVDDHVVGRPHEIGLHLFGHGEHAIADDGGEHGVGVGALRGNRVHV